MASGAPESGDGNGKKHDDAGALSRWPLRDLVISYKGCLRNRRRSCTSGHQPQQQALAQTSPTLPTSLIKEFKSRATGNMYPYTKDPDFGNEGLGYGDLVRVKLLTGATLAPTAHVARRTRSGITPLEPSDVRFLEEPERKPQQGTEAGGATKNEPKR